MRRGYYQITERGEQVLEENLPGINSAYLRQFPKFVEFQTPKRDKAEEGEEEILNDTQTPEEEIEAAYQRVRQGLAADLLQTIKDHSPAFFERVVIDLLVRMGYGGTRRDAGEAMKSKAVAHHALASDRVFGVVNCHTWERSSRGLLGGKAVCHI
jgi:restriction system protein